MPINLDDTVFMRQLRIQQVQQAQQERLGAMQVASEGSAKVQEIKNQGLREGEEAARAEGAVAAGTGQPAPQHENARVQQQSQIGYRGKQAEQQAKQQAHNFDMLKLTTEWSNRQGMAEVKNLLAEKMNQDKIKAANYRAQQSNALREQSNQIAAMAAATGMARESRQGQDSRARELSALSRFMRDNAKKDFMQNMLPMSQQPREVQARIFNAAEYLGMNPQQLFGEAAQGAEQVAPYDPNAPSFEQLQPVAPGIPPPPGVPVAPQGPSGASPMSAVDRLSGRPY